MTETPSAICLYKGLSIYRVANSPNWMVRVWDRGTNRGVTSFLSPISTELYALTHGNMLVADEPKRLILTIKDGKTGYRSSNTMPGAVSIDERIRQRSPDHNNDTPLFLPDHTNRTTAAKVVQRQFNAVLDQTGLEVELYTQKKHTLYPLRQTSICMRIVNSHGKTCGLQGTQTHSSGIFITYS